MGSNSDSVFLQSYNRSSSSWGHIAFLTKSETMRLTTDGYLGIGVTSPSATLDVQGSSALFMTRTSSGLATYIENDGGYAAQYMYQIGGGQKIKLHTNGVSFFNGGNVGIGTTAPSQLLHVNSTTSNATGIGLQNSQRYYAVRSNNYSLVFSDETVGSERMRIDSSGNLGIGTSSPETKLHVDGTTLVKDSDGVGDLYLGNNASHNYFRFHTNNSNTYFDMNCGDIYWRQGASTRYYFYASTANMTINGTLTQNSDSRVKENIVEIGDCVSKVQAMRGVYYNRTDFNTEVTKVGVIAQEVEAVLPELILESPEDGLKSVAYAELSAVLINAIKEQQEQIESLKTRIQQLEN